MTKPHTSYIVCSTPRSGSSFLCEALSITGLAGRPEEYLSQSRTPLWLKKWRCSSFIDYFQKVLERRTTINGIFGIKLMWDHMTRLIHELGQSSQYQHCLDRPVSPNLILPNLHYILITRRDKIRQAVSWDILVQTGISERRNNKPFALKTRPIFDFNRIDFLYCRIMAAESAWERYFNSTGTIPLIVVYEDFIENYNQTLFTIFHQLNIPLSEHYVFRRGQLKKMSDALNEDWVERYKEMQVHQEQDGTHLHRHIAQMLT